MIKNIIIGILILITLFLSYTVFALKQGERPTEVVLDDYKNDPSWITYKSVPLGIEISHPRDMELTEESGNIKIRNSVQEIKISNDSNSSIDDLIKWTPLTHQISNYQFDDDKTRSHIVIIYEKEKLANPIIYAKHLITSPSNKGILKIDTVSLDPITYKIINTIKFIK